MKADQDQTNAIAKTTIEVAIRLILVLVLVAWCIAILLPFLNPLLWGAIIAIAVAPFYQRIRSWIGGSRTLAATLLTVFLLILVIVPGFWLIDSLFEGLAHLGGELRQGKLTIPPPDDRVLEWPVAGEQISAMWQAASTNLRDFLLKYKDQVEQIGNAVLNAAISLSSSLILFIVSFIIAGILLRFAEDGERSINLLFEKLLGDTGHEVSSLTIITVRNVAKGILLVSTLQAVLSGIVFVLADVPFAGLWAFIILILAIVHLTPMIVTIPVVVYIFSIHDPLIATLWTVILLAIAASDNILKPLLMGKGAPVPMLIIFIGAIGGFILLGFVGLFTGAIVLSLGYKLFIFWLTAGSGGMADQERSTS